MRDLIVIGGGLAGTEAAWQAAEHGIRVRLFEMRPILTTGAHATDYLAELVCSNSLGSNLPDRASGVLKTELRKLGSMVLDCADKTAIPAGGALAVDRIAFAETVTNKINNHPNIEVIRQEVSEIPEGPVIIASGPLTSLQLTQAIAETTGENHLSFYDAIAPIVSFDSINFEIVFRGSRHEHYDRIDGDYLNCPFTQEEYEVFVNELIHADRIEVKAFEHEIESGVKAGIGRYFEGCLPIEVLARRGVQSLAFGPMRPVGLINPKGGKRPRAVLQLRQDNLAGSLYNLVGFQTNLTFPEQRRVFRMIPGLDKAEFVRYGQMHRNTFIASPKLLLPTLQLSARPDLYFAGQITGVEGYIGNIGTGLIAGINAARTLIGRNPLILPKTTMLGALCHYVTHANLIDFQPMKANFGILPVLDIDGGANKRIRAGLYSNRAISDLDRFLEQNNYMPIKHPYEKGKSA